MEGVDIPYLRRTLFMLVISLSVFALCHAVQLLDEVILLSCQGLGTNLFSQCIIVPTLTPQQLTQCSILKVSYILCITELNAPYPLIPSIIPDIYYYSPFTPCTYEISNLILPGICAV